MKLIDELKREGGWLFRWRSYLPLAILPIAVPAFAGSGWFAAAFGTAAEDRWDWACLILPLVGLAMRVLTVGYVPSMTSGRSTQLQHAASLNTTGMYSIVRHPLYVANFLVFIGFTLTLKSVLFTLLAALAYVVYYERIVVAEEDFLEKLHEEEFRRWAARTPTAIPQPALWVANELSFSWRTALLREYHGVMLIGTVFFIIKLLEGLLIRQQTLSEWIGTEHLYVTMLVACTAFYLIAQFMRKRTNWLTVEGRGP
ncbi:MAG: DUF1295 domain-containing protein [Pseudolabrys sp.]|nr:DUF1295 domain-containing protein [Pseudolabrys sp.]